MYYTSIISNIFHEPAAAYVYPTSISHFEMSANPHTLAYVGMSFEPSQAAPLEIDTPFLSFDEFTQNVLSDNSYFSFEPYMSPHGEQGLIDSTSLGSEYSYG